MCRVATILCVAQLKNAMVPAARFVTESRRASPLG
jgi:hypothetical protein